MVDKKNFLSSSAPPGVTAAFIPPDAKLRLSAGLRQSAEFKPDAALPHEFLKGQAAEREAFITELQDLIEQTIADTLPCDRFIEDPQARLHTAKQFGNGNITLAQIADYFGQFIPHAETKSALQMSLRLVSESYHQRLRHAVLVRAHQRGFKPEQIDVLTTGLNLRRKNLNGFCANLSLEQTNALFKFLLNYEMLSTFKQLMHEKDSHIPADIKRYFPKWYEKDKYELISASSFRLLLLKTGIDNAFATSYSALNRELAPARQITLLKVRILTEPEYREKLTQKELKLLTYNLLKTMSVPALSHGHIEHDIHTDIFVKFSPETLSELLRQIRKNGYYDFLKDEVMKENTLAPNVLRRAFQSELATQAATPNPENPPRDTASGIAVFYRSEILLPGKKIRKAAVHNFNETASKGTIEKINRVELLKTALETEADIDHEKSAVFLVSASKRGDAAYHVFHIVTKSGIVTQVALNERKNDGTYILKKQEDLICLEDLQQDNPIDRTLLSLLDRPYVQLRKCYMNDTRKYYGYDNWLDCMIALVKTDPEKMEAQVKRTPHWTHQGPQLLNSVRAFVQAVGRAPNEEDDFIVHGSDNEPSKPSVSLKNLKNWRLAAQAVKGHKIYGLGGCDTLADVAALPGDFEI